MEKKTCCDRTRMNRWTPEWLHVSLHWLQYCCSFRQVKAYLSHFYLKSEEHSIVIYASRISFAKNTNGITQSNAFEHLGSISFTGTSAGSDN